MNPDNPNNQPDDPDQPNNDPKPIGPLEKTYEIGPLTEGGSSKWKVYERAKDAKVDVCNGAQPFAEGGDAPTGLDFLDRSGKLEIPVPDIDDDHKLCNFVANDASKGGDILCNGAPKIECPLVGGTDLQMCGVLSETPGPIYQPVWVRNG